MKFVTRDTDYAIQAILLIAEGSLKEKNKIISVDSIVDKLGLPKEHLRALLKKLASNPTLPKNIPPIITLYTFESISSFKAIKFQLFP